MSWPSACRPRSPRPWTLEKEPESIRELYGLNNAVTEPMGRKCLMARRMVERGVRFVPGFQQQLGLPLRSPPRSTPRRGLETDRPIAGLLQDLKQRGLLDETLVVWGGEFGRTPESGRGLVKETMGREHNKEAMVMWFAGGGRQAGDGGGRDRRNGTRGR